MSNEDGSIWVTYNGEIYNHDELRRDLEARGHRFLTRCDTEVVVHGYEEWGAACVTRFRGMFAFAVLDEKMGSIFLARDRLGIKPLYYFRDARRFAFASELSAFEAMEDPPSALNIPAVADYLRHACIPAPATIYREVFKLPPGHTMCVSTAGKIETPRRYWTLAFEPDESIGEEEWMERVEALLRESVRIRLMSDVPFGAFLSGGVDSSTVVALMAQTMSSPVKTFSIGFENEEFSELRYARAVAERYATEHHEEVIRPDALKILPEIVAHHGEPFGDSSAIPTHYVARLAASHVKMVLSGDGGDENFAGYSWYRDTVEAFSGCRGALRRRLGVLLGDKSDPMRTSAEALSVFGAVDRKALLQPDFQMEETRSASPVGPDLCSRLQLRDFGGYLPDDILAKVDIATMACGLEAREPLLDHQFVELSARIPWRFKLQRVDGRLEGKAILRKLASKWIDRDLLNRPKQGFAVPLRDWFAPGARDVIREQLLDRSSRLGEILKIGEVERLVNSPGDVGNRLWTLLVLAEWLGQHPKISLS